MTTREVTLVLHSLPAHDQPEENVLTYLGRISALNSALRAFTTTYPGTAVAAARLAAQSKSPLGGLAVAVKDVIDIEGSPTTAGSESAAKAVANRDAEVVKRLRNQGAAILGKTTTWEYAVGNNPEIGPFPRTRNPHSIDHETGGSSSGAAVAVAAGMVEAAIGTDTGGSIRSPSSWCGVVGFKPTHGAVSTDGVLPLAPSLDCIGTIARDVDTAAALFHAIADNHPSPAEAKAKASCSNNESGKPLQGACIALWHDALDACATTKEVRNNFERVAQLLSAAGAEIRSVSLPSLAVINSVCFLIARHESFRCYREQLSDPEWRNGLGSSARALLLGGGLVSPGEFTRAQQLRNELTDAVSRGLAGIDVVLTPTMPTVAPPLSGGPGIMASTVPQFVRFASLTGRPSVTIPSGKAGNGLPFGILLNGNHGRDNALLKIAASVQLVLGQAGMTASLREVS